MSVDSVIKPQNIPFPLGPATFKDSQLEKAFPGGHLPSEKYPLVSILPGPKPKSAKILSQQDFEKIKNIITKEDESEEARAEQARKEQLKEVSQSLRFSWGDSGKTYLQILKENADDAKAQKELKEDQDFARINESKRQERVQYVQEAWKQLRQQDEAFLGIRSALCQAQALEENAQSLALKHQIKAKHQEEEKKELATHLETADQFEHTLRCREVRMKARDLEIQAFQLNQMEKKRLDSHVQRQEAWQRHQARVKLSESLKIKEKALVEDRRRFYQDLQEARENLSKQRADRLTWERSAENDTLRRAQAQQQEFEAKKKEFEEQLRQRTINIGQRQWQAHQRLGEMRRADQSQAEVKEAKRMQRVQRFAEDLETSRRQRKDHDKAQATKEQRDFIQADKKIKASRADIETLNRLAERAQNEDKFCQYLDHVHQAQEDKVKTQDVYKQFWADQVGEMEAKANRDRSEARDFQADKVKKEEQEDVEVAQHLEAVINDQVGRGGEVQPLLRHKRSIGIGLEPVVIASDTSGIRIHSKNRQIPKCKEFSAHDQRDRMSLNWE